MIPTFVTIIILLLVFSKKFREGFLLTLKFLPDYYESLVIKYKESIFKLSILFIITSICVDVLLVIFESIFNIPSTVISNFISDLISAILLLILLNRAIKVLFSKTFFDLFKSKMKIFNSLLMILLSIMLVYGITSITYPIAQLLPTSKIFDEIRIEMLHKPQNHLEAILLFLSISIIPAFIEEIFFRGVLYQTIRRKYGIGFSTFFLTIIFYLFHLDPQMIFFLIIGNLVLCLTYEYTKSLVIPFVIHAGINFSSLLFYMNDVAGKT